MWDVDPLVTIYIIIQLAIIFTLVLLQKTIAYTKNVQHDIHITCWSCRFTVTRRVALVEQELLILPEHVKSPPVFSGIHVVESLVLYLVCCR